MLVAINNEGQRIHPKKGQKGFCPVCNETVIAKCGDVKIHHWAHEVDYDCIEKEPESQWHLYNKNLFDIKYQEKIVWVLGAMKRADIKLDNNLVIEFQNSPINTYDVESREFHHMKMIWVINVNEKKNFFIYNNSFEWHHPIKNLYDFRFPIFLSFENYYIRVLNYNYDTFLKEEWHMHNTTRLMGRCKILNKDQFINFVNILDKKIQGYSIQNFRNIYYNL